MVVFSHMRETLVNIMARPAASRPSDSLRQWAERGQLSADGTEGSVSTDSAEDQLPMDPSTSIFWSAVGMGALVKGNPVQLVRTLMLATVETLLIFRVSV